MIIQSFIVRIFYSLFNSPIAGCLVVSWLFKIINNATVNTFGHKSCLQFGLVPLGSNPEVDQKQKHFNHHRF